MSQGGFVSNFEWKNLAAVFFTHLARTLGMFCGILNQTHVANSHTAFGQLFWFSGKCVLVQKVIKSIIKRKSRKVKVFGHMVVSPLPFNNSWKSENRVSKSKIEFPAVASI